MYDLVIEGRTLVGGGLQEVSLCIEGGIIKDVKKEAPPPYMAGETHRLGRSVLLPGLVDSHVHMRDPGLTAKEDLRTGSLSAAFGGVTTFLDMPNTIPPVRDWPTLRMKDEEARFDCYVDYGLYMALDSAMDPKMVAAYLMSGGPAPPPIAFKAFLGETTGSLSFGPIGQLSRYGSVLEGAGSVVAVHAEDGSMFRDTAHSRSGKGIMGSHCDSRPPASEASAIGQAIAAMTGHQDRLHVLHVSSEQGLKAVSGSAATIEVTPHHLLLDLKWGEKSLENEALCKVNPPIRGTADRAALWEAVTDGRVHTLGSDHAPHLIGEKSKGIGSPSGIPGVETMGPLMLAEVGRKRLSLPRFAELLCSNPAKRFALETKGSLADGMDADIVAFSPRNTREIRGEDLHSKCGWTPYEGFDAIFPDRVYSRGELVIESDQPAAKPGRGRNVRA